MIYGISGLDEVRIDPTILRELGEGEVPKKNELKRFVRRREYWIQPVENKARHIDFGSSKVYAICEDGEIKEVLGVVRGQVLRDYSQQLIEASGEAA